MERSERIRALERAMFKVGNTYLMVPLLRVGLGRLISSPLTGYFMLLRTTGRRSGLPRGTPLNYAIDDGAVVCLAGFGERANWLQNIRSDPQVHVRLPDRQDDGLAAVVADRAEARRLAVAVARNCGFALVFEHPRCLLMSDAQLAARLDERPVVRIELAGGPVSAGPYDPGGRGWVLPMLGQLVAMLLLLRWLAQHVRRRQLEPGGG
jgi:deazaflavin-dependent oxidoreductase (nitroreductase family)